jgi:2-keto-4-pentenoate hydratase
MTLHRDEIETIAAELAFARSHHRIVDNKSLLQDVATFSEARSVQSAAGVAFSDTPIGFKLTGTSPLAARRLELEAPIWGRLFDEDRLPSGSDLMLYPGLIGVGPQFAFVFGRSFPQNEDEARNPESVIDAISSCRLSLDVIGRRTNLVSPHTAVTATADFALASTYVEGPTVDDWQDRLDGSLSTTLHLGYHALATGQANSVMGDPLHAVSWLARQLCSMKRTIDAGDIVATGSVTAYIQMTPGQIVIGDFAHLGEVRLILR